MQHWPLKSVLLSVILLMQFFSCYQQTTSQSSSTELPEVIQVASANTLSIAYIGNMGVLLESDTQTIIIDGFHDFLLQFVIIIAILIFR